MTWTEQNWEIQLFLSLPSDHLTPYSCRSYDLFGDLRLNECKMSAIFSWYLRVPKRNMKAGNSRWRALFSESGWIPIFAVEVPIWMNAACTLFDTSKINHWFKALKTRFFYSSSVGAAFDSRGGTSIEAAHSDVSRFYLLRMWGLLRNK